ncbi:unnamed protein product [Gongylonema pulchrum]|uniref:Deltameth_res domain-containing protein n=1 Tax=Gongylonema pulchrum TaxID=637853 RepID=A0A183EVA6_9BILA|nr:unnamed protein product [Gongylonema pulchrum]
MSQCNSTMVDHQQDWNRLNVPDKMYAKLILPHVGLVLLTCAYTVVGASIFYSVEQPHELASKRRQVHFGNQ